MVDIVLTSINGSGYKLPFRGCRRALPCHGFSKGLPLHNGSGLWRFPLSFWFPRTLWLVPKIPSYQTASQRFSGHVDINDLLGVSTLIVTGFPKFSSLNLTNLVFRRSRPRRNLED